MMNRSGRAALTAMLALSVASALAVAACAFPREAAATSSEAVAPEASVVDGTTVSVDSAAPFTDSTSALIQIDSVAPRIVERQSSSMTALRSGNDSTPGRLPGGVPGPGVLSFLIGMTALVGERDTRRRDGKFYSRAVDAAQKIYAGAIVVLKAGFANPGSTALNLIAVGRAVETIDNSAGAAGDLSVRFERGVFLYANSAAADAIAATEIGKTCYIVDDQTVAKTDGAGTRSAAGTVRDVEAAGVWVEI